MWIVAGIVLAIVSAALDVPGYTSTATFAPQTTTSPNRSGLASLAGQFGIELGGESTPQNSPDFYVDLLKSRVVLEPILADTFSLAAGGKHGTLLDLLDVKAATPGQRMALGVSRLRGLEKTSIAPKTEVVSLSTTTDWPDLSFALTRRLLAAVNDFNLRTRQSQASEERRFTETRVAEARTGLRAAEDQMQTFLQSNRQWQNSPDLRFQEERLERAVAFSQQMVTSLAQSYEEVRIREVRNTPVITVIEPPAVPSVPNPRHTAARLLVGVIVGGLVGVMLALIRALVGRRRAVGDPEAGEFFQALGDVRLPFRARTPTRLETTGDD